MEAADLSPTHARSKRVQRRGNRGKGALSQKEANAPTKGSQHTHTHLERGDLQVVRLVVLCPDRHHTEGMRPPQPTVADITYVYIFRRRRIPEDRARKTHGPPWVETVGGGDKTVRIYGVYGGWSLVARHAWRMYAPEKGAKTAHSRDRTRHTHFPTTGRFGLLTSSTPEYNAGTLHLDRADHLQIQWRVPATKTPPLVSPVWGNPYSNPNTNPSSAAETLKPSIERRRLLFVCACDRILADDASSAEHDNTSPRNQSGDIHGSAIWLRFSRRISRPARVNRHAQRKSRRNCSRALRSHVVVSS